MRDKISACLTVGNEEKNIRRCLDSIAWVDEIVVIDSFSVDRTPEICRQYTERVYQHEWLGYVGQKELIKTMASHDWILFIDADEEVSPELREETLAEFESGRNRQYDGYEFPRKVFFLGKWITRGEWWPDLKMRLYRKDKGVCTGREPHDHVLVKGPIKRLRNSLNHYTYDDIADQIATQYRFSSISSATLQQGYTRHIGCDMVFRPLFRFFKGYILKRGFLDGYRGLIISTLIAIGVFFKYAKLWELKYIKSQDRSDDAASLPNSNPQAAEADSSQT
ncbi:MAG: glycosyltransferase family 2 protein [Lentisphaerae bacterium]|nr:glycosyltransferase family 2 protein [Lentisphaerota bacterium]